MKQQLMALALVAAFAAPALAQDATSTATSTGTQSISHNKWVGSEARISGHGNSNSVSNVNNANTTTTSDASTTNNATFVGRDSLKLRNTPDLFIGAAASGPCTGLSGGVGVSVAGFAIGANAASTDRGCSLRELARVAAIVGREDIACLAVERAGLDLGLAVVVTECKFIPLTVEAARPPIVVVTPAAAPAEVAPTPTVRVPKEPRG